MPVLDIDGANEYPAVKRLAPERLRQIRQAGNPKSEQRVVSGADHDFTDAGSPLLASTSGGLEKDLAIQSGIKDNGFIAVFACSCFRQFLSPQCVADPSVSYPQPSA